MNLFILDLDNCLIFTSYSEIQGIQYNSKRKWHYLYHRPGLNDFLKYVQKTGEIAFYTSSKMDYAKWIVSTFNLNKSYRIFSRKYCRKKCTDYGEIYFKSLANLDLQKEYTKIVVLDDRTDLWDETGVELNDINPFFGELNDSELEKWFIKRLKLQPKIGL
jgi:TFIIF-interacting CTD phosphatase-like protein